MNKKESKKDKDEDLLIQIREHFTLAEEYYSEQRQQAREDFRFRAGDQWEEGVKLQRQNEMRPALTINKLQQFVRQIVNNQKINRPQINVKAMDSLADIDIARIYEGLIQNIQKNSFAEDAYDTAFDCAVTGGEGYFRIITDYVDAMSFDQEIYIRPIDNPFSVYIDPNFKSNFDNMDWAFIFEQVPLEQFKREYPDAEATNDLGLGFKELGDWITLKNVVVAEYFYKHCEEIDIVLLASGQVLSKEDYNNLSNKEDLEVIKERTTFKHTVKWVKTNGYEILDSTDFPGSRIPVIPVFADTYMVEGKRFFEGVIRQSKEPQKAYNYWASAEAEMIALSPKAPYIGAQGQFAGHESKWNQINSKNFGYVEYSPVALNGQNMPPPARQQFDPAINTIIAAKNASNEDLKATTGMYNASFGVEEKNPSSGVALISKQRQSEVTSFMYIDNLSKSLKLAGRILIDMIPYIYDNKRIIRITGETNKPDSLITINDSAEDSVILGIGRYDVDVTIGPYGENQRQQAIESMLSLMQINPAISQIIGDIFVAKQDWPGAQEIAERLKIMLPPALQNNGELPPELQAQIAQITQEAEAQLQGAQGKMLTMQTMIADLTSKLNKVTAEYENKTAEIESREKIEALKARVELIKVGIKEDSLDSRMAFQQELAWTGAKQRQASDDIPMQQDTIVLPGVNDPVTEVASENQQVMTPEEEADLQSKLQNLQ